MHKHKHEATHLAYNIRLVCHSGVSHLFPEMVKVKLKEAIQKNRHSMKATQ